MQQELQIIRTIKKRIRSKELLDHNVTLKLWRVDEFLEKAWENFDELKSRFQTLPEATYSGIFPDDPMVTHDGFCYKLILLFQYLTQGGSLDPKNSSYLFELDTMEFDCSGSIFSRKQSFIVPHNGFILGRQSPEEKCHFGPSDCISLIQRYYPKIPETEFFTSTLWHWIESTESRKINKILDHIFSKTNVLNPGVLLLIQTHIWIVLGIKDSTLYLISYRRQEWTAKKHGFMLETIDWPLPSDTVYAILQPLS